MFITLLACLASCTIGFGIAALFAGKEPGRKGKVPSLKFKVNDYTVHLHHWLYASVIVVVFPATMRVHITLLFFFVGIIVQGLTYPDFYKVVYRHGNGDA